MAKLFSVICFMFCLIYSPTATTTHLEKADLVSRNIVMLSKMIKTIQPNLTLKKSDTLAEKIYANAVDFEVDPKIIIAILATESNFRNNVTSNTGDISMAQINERIWNKEFARIGADEIDGHLMKHNESYVIYKMTKILSILKERYQKRDANWYASYHSQTKKLKNIYTSKLNIHFKKMNKIAMEIN